MNNEEESQLPVKHEDQCATDDYINGGDPKNYGDFRPDHGSSFVPGAGPEHLAPKSLDHFKRGYEERTSQRDKEFYTVNGATNGETQIVGRESPSLTQAAPASSLSNISPEEQKQEFTASPALQAPPQNQPTGNDVGGYPREIVDYTEQPRGNANGAGREGPTALSHQNSYNDDYDRDYFDDRGYDDEPFVNEKDLGGRFGRGGNLDDANAVNNGTGFGGRGGRGGIGNRRYMDDPWGYRDRPTVLQGLDINALMDRLADLSQGNNPDKLFAELDRVRSEYKQIFETGKAMTALISVAARRKQIGLGHAVWDWMDLAKLPKNTFHYNSMISVAEKAKNYQQALDLLNEMTKRSIPKNEVTFSSAISACEKCGQWKIALDLLNSMEDEGVARTAIAYNAAISACEKGMVPQKACEVFQRMKRENIAPSVVSYSALISAAEKGSQWKLALEILEEMKLEGFHGNVVAYSAAISALAKGQQWRKALELFREIQSHGGTPSIVTYNATMTALEKGMQWERALDLFEEMKMRNLPITVVSYGSAISACDKGFQYRQCLEFLDEMTEMGIPKNVIIFGAAMSCMEKCSRADIGFQLMKRMKEEGIAPNVHIYNSAISACARCNLWEKGYELFQEMDEVNVRKDVVTYNAVLDAVASQIRLGRMLFEEGIQKGFYAKVSRLGEHWFELDLHFLSLGGGEIALGWWFEECLVPYLVNTEKLKNVKSISIVTGYGKTRTRGRRFGDDGMRKRCKAMLQFMSIQELAQPNAGRIHVDKESLITEVNKNGGKVIFDLDGYIRWKENETAVNAVPDTPQMIRARFKPQVTGSGRPPFTRIENEHTTPDYRLENQKKRGFYVDDKPVASVFEDLDDAVGISEPGTEETRNSGRISRVGRDGDEPRRGGFRGGGLRGYNDDRRGFREREERSYGGGDGRSFNSREPRDAERSRRLYNDSRRNYNGEPGNERFEERRAAGGGNGRSSWRGDSHYGPDGKYEAGSNRRGGYDDGPRERFEDNSNRNISLRRPMDRQDDEFDRRNNYSSVNKSDDVDRMDKRIQEREHRRANDDNDDYGRSQRSYDREGGAIPMRQGGSYPNDSSFGMGGSRRGFRPRQGVDDKTFDGANSSYGHSNTDNDVRKRGYDEADHRTSSRGYALEPQNQKRRFS